MKNNASCHHRRSAPALVAASLAALAVLLAGCGSAPPTHFHTLMPPPSANEQPSVATRIDWDVLPVVVPMQVDQPQWVVRTADGSLIVLEQERWIAPLGDEIRGAVVERLTKAFGPPQVGSPANGAATWRIRIDVQRFDLVPNREARLEADWSVRGAGVAVTCHAAVSQQVSEPGYVALARAQQQAVAQLAEAIGAVLKLASKDPQAAC